MIEVPIVRLDEEFPDPLSRPALLKLDVQGSELSAIKGGAKLISSIDWLVLEVSLRSMYDGEAPMAEYQHRGSRGLGLRSAVGHLETQTPRQSN